jgi:hypothetical protein
MNKHLRPGGAAAWPEFGIDVVAEEPDEATTANRDWETDRTLMLERSERRAWTVAVAGHRMNSGPTAITKVRNSLASVTTNRAIQR